jgi:hypothetical protein
MVSGSIEALELGWRDMIVELVWIRFVGVYRKRGE